MSRCFEFMGLPSEFEVFQKEHKLKQIGSLEFKEYFYSDGYALKIYEDKNGEKYEEFECGCPWNGGPQLFLGLKKQNGEIVLKWSNSRMGLHEDVTLPEAYNKKIMDGFVLEYNLPLVQGYCPLYVEKSEHKLCLYQDVNHAGDPDQLYREIELNQPQDGDIIIDWLYQQGFSVEETQHLFNLRFNV